MSPKGVYLIEPGGVKKIIAIALALLLVNLEGYKGFGMILSNDIPADDMVFFSGLTPGWNVGNSLDAYSDGFYSNDIYDYEELWHNPGVDRQLFRTIADGGFKSVRIPITWFAHMNGEGIVNERWMRRVKQAVDEALGCGLYVIINSHHDDWYSPFDWQIDEAEKKLGILWGQISAAFEDYDTRLLFEGMNEPRLVGTEYEWAGGTREAREAVNRLNRVFVETVRSSGENNAGRYLLVPTYAAGIYKEVIEDFVLPETDRIAVSVHMYLPFDFAHEPNETGEWSSKNLKDIQGIDMVFNELRRRFISRGTAVVITEFGAVDKNNLETRVKWVEYITAAANKNHIPYIWWDGGTHIDGGPNGSFSLLDRFSLRWIFPDIVSALRIGNED